jgi:hypothetical protein
MLGHARQLTPSAEDLAKGERCRGETNEAQGGAAGASRAPDR